MIKEEQSTRRIFQLWRSTSRSLAGEGVRRVCGSGGLAAPSKRFSKFSLRKLGEKSEMLRKFSYLLEIFTKICPVLRKLPKNIRKKLYGAGKEP